MPQYKIHHRLRFMKYKYINSTLLGFKHEMALSWLASLGIILYTVVFPSQANLTTVTPFTPNWSQNGLNVSPIHRVNQYIVLMNKKRHIFGSGFDWKWYLIVFNSSDGRPTTGQHHLCAPLDRTDIILDILDSLVEDILMHYWFVVLKGCSIQLSVLEKSIKNMIWNKQGGPVSEFAVSTFSNCWN